MNIGRVQAEGFEISPLVASANLEAEAVDLRITDAALCAITLSGYWRAGAETAEAKLNLTARGAQLQNSIRCLTKQRVDLTGKLDMDGAFSAQGKLGTLLDGFQGTFSATASDGHINKADRLAAVLKWINVTQVIAGQMPDLSKGGMNYRSLKVQGRIEGHKIFFHEIALDAAALTMAAHGNVDYATEAMDMTVLVAPFKTVSWVVGHIPILRSIFGGMLIAVPVHIGGTLSKPLIVPLGPSAVGSRLLDIMGNTLKLPGQAINIVTPPANATQQPTTPTQSSPAPSAR